MTETATFGLPALPEGFRWENPDTWPSEFRELFEYAARVAYLGLIDMDKRMLNVQITGTTEPVTMLFAIGDRAKELRRAWNSVYAIHNDVDASTANATGTGDETTSDSEHPS